MLKVLFTLLLFMSFGYSIEIPGAISEVYKRASDYDLLLHRIDPPNHSDHDSKAAIVFFFGGGWKGGNPTQFQPQGEYLAKRGMVVFLADYRVKSRQKTSPRECAFDGRSAIRYVRKNAKKFNIDPNRIAAGGGSAGGHVAAITGMCEGFDEPSEDLNISGRSNILVLFNPVYDNSPEGYGYESVETWFPEISPMHNITQDDPSTIVFLGEKDDLIPVKTAKDFQSQQKHLGIYSELHIYEGQPHGFFNIKKGGVGIFKDTVLKTDAFLVKHGYLQGIPDNGALEAVVTKYNKKKNKKR